MLRDKMEPIEFESRQLNFPVDLDAFLMTIYNFLTSNIVPFDLRMKRKSLSLIGLPLNNHSYFNCSFLFTVSCPLQCSCKLLPRKPDTLAAGRLVNLRPGSLSFPHVVSVC